VLTVKPDNLLCGHKDSNPFLQNSQSMQVSASLSRGQIRLRIDHCPELKVINIPLDTDIVADLEIGIGVFANSNDGTGSFVSTAKVVLGLERPVTLGCMQISLQERSQGQIRRYAQANREETELTWQTPEYKTLTSASPGFKSLG
jgi:hypothetical protein